MSKANRSGLHNKSNIKSLDRSSSQPSLHQFLTKSISRPSLKKHISYAYSTTTTIHPAIPITKPQHSCPLCGKSLFSMSTSSRSIHINMCLDLPTRKRRATNPKPLTPSHSRIVNRIHSSSAVHSKRRSHSTSALTPSFYSKQEHYNTFKVISHPSNLIVDGFASHNTLAPQDAIFFLSHFHSDHYTGLKSTFNGGLIYCSEITRQLVLSELVTCSDFVVSLSMYTRHFIPHSSPPTFVTLLDANHCPGAVMFLFEMHNNSPQSEIRYHLHVGDARCEFECESAFYKANHELLSRYYKRIDKLYLDTTYLQSRMELPRQSDAICFVARKCKEYLTAAHKDVVIVIGTYTIGKERILEQVAKQCGEQIYISARKQRIVNIVYAERSVDRVLFSSDANCRVRVVSMRQVNFKEMWKYRKTPSTLVVGFKPTGWTSEGYSHCLERRKHVIKPRYASSKANAMVIYDVPYSEHSSFAELCKFVSDVDAKEIVPTVDNRCRTRVREQVKCLKDAVIKGVDLTYHELSEDEDYRKQSKMENYMYALAS